MSWLVPREIRTYGIRKALDAVDVEIARSLGPAGDASDDGGEDDGPIFVLSAGWRSGSTLVQRLLVSDPDVLIWGEPFGEAVPVPRLTSMIDAFKKKAPNRGKDAYDVVTRDDGEPLCRRWIANLNPGFATLRQAHRAFFDTLLMQPARQRGYRRWGAKWVRLSADHAIYLKWLYPNARFVFLVRDPRDAFHSYKGRRWFSVNPVARVENALHFAAHWRFLVDSFLREQERLGALLVRYEALVRDPDELRRIEAHCGVSLRESVLAAEIGATSQKQPLRFWDRAAVRLLTGPTLRRLDALTGVGTRS